jgi:DNA polymerase I/DNA polymerase-2
METSFIPIDYDYFDFQGKNYIQLIGKNSKCQKICIIDDYEPNFWIILKENSNVKIVEKKISKITLEKSSRVTKVIKTKVQKKKYLGKEVTAIQVFVNNHKDLQDIASEIGEDKSILARREFDINIITKYIKEKNVLPLQTYDVTGSVLSLEDFAGFAKGIAVDQVIYAKKIILSKKQEVYTPTVLAYDIETTGREIGKGEVLMIALYGKNYKKVLTWKKTKNPQDYVKLFDSEKDMLEAFADEVNKINPDILTGYFSDGFDLPYLYSSAKKKKAVLDVGLDRKGPHFNRGRIPTGKINGIIHIDIYRFISAVYSQYLKSESLSLNEVAKELIGDQKEDFDFSKLNNLDNLSEEEWKNFYSYNLQDTKVTYDLLWKIWPDICEFTKIIQEPIFKISRNRMATHVENYLIHNLNRFNEIAEKRPGPGEIGKRRAMEKFEGAFVFEPTPGLYEDIAMFDFTSMYASVIVSYNLSKSTIKDDGTFESSKKLGFFPTLLAEIIEKRKKHKKEYLKNPTGYLRARSNAYKLLANASYGYQAYFGGRYYCREAAAATAKFARDNIKNTIATMEKENCKVIYGDTDSVVVLRNKKDKKEMFKILKKINDSLPGIMELDLEDFFKRGIFVSGRDSTRGAKKKYALIDEEDNLKIRGFETVRRDWCQLTRKLQNSVLTHILEDGNEIKALIETKNVIKNLKNRKVNLKDLIIKTQLRRQITEYKSQGPHVIAAKKIKAKGISVATGTIIEYYVGEISGKAKKIGDKVFLPGEKAKYDTEYYLNHQILPAVENIFDIFDINIKEIAEGESQKKLF